MDFVLLFTALNFAVDFVTLFYTVFRDKKGGDKN